MINPLMTIVPFLEHDLYMVNPHCIISVLICMLVHVYASMPFKKNFFFS